MAHTPPPNPTVWLQAVLTEEFGEGRVFQSVKTKVPNWLITHRMTSGSQEFKGLPETAGVRAHYHFTAVAPTSQQAWDLSYRALQAIEDAYLTDRKVNNLGCAGFEIINPPFPRYSVNSIDTDQHHQYDFIARLFFVFPPTKER